MKIKVKVKERENDSDSFEVGKIYVVKRNKKTTLNELYGGFPGKIDSISHNKILFRTRDGNLWPIEKESLYDQPIDHMPKLSVVLKNAYHHLNPKALAIFSALLLIGAFLLYFLTGSGSLLLAIASIITLLIFFIIIIPKSRGFKFSIDPVWEDLLSNIEDIETLRILLNKRCPLFRFLYHLYDLAWSLAYKRPDLIVILMGFPIGILIGILSLFCIKLVFSIL